MRREVTDRQILISRFGCPDSRAAAAGLRDRGAREVVVTDGAAPATQALITQQVPADAQGRIQGSMSSLVSLAGIFAPAVFAGSFGFFIGPHAPVRMPGIAFLIAALMLAIAAFVAWRFTDAVHLPAKAAGEPAA